MKKLVRLAVVLLLVSSILPARRAGAQLPQQLPFTMRAFVVNMSNVATGASGIMEIRIEKWSTAAEREQLITTMVEKGQDQTLRALQKQSVKGRMRLPGWMGPDPQNYRLGWNLRYAWLDPLPEGGDRIVIGTDRYMSMREMANQPRTYDYPFTFIEIHMPKEGKGEGRLIGATKLLFDKKTKTISLEQFSAGITHLNEITVEKR